MGMPRRTDTSLTRTAEQKGEAMQSAHTCPRCGIIHRNGTFLCQTCRKYERNGGVWHTLPDAGNVEYDDQGRPICHICGMALDKLMEHVRRKHHMTSEEYRRSFDLMRKKARLTSPKYSDMMRKHVDDTPTWVENFSDIHCGKIPNGRRKDPRWTNQEREVRRSAQKQIALCKRKKN